MGVLFTVESSNQTAVASEADFSASHVCPGNRPILIRSYPQGGMLVTVWACNDCHFLWADADLSEALKANHV
jgi:hypothetical protein